MNTNKMTYPAVREAVVAACRVDVTRPLALRAETVNENQRSVEAILATENRVTVVDFRAMELLDEVLLMRGARLPESGALTLLADHRHLDVDQVMGTARELRIDGGQLVGRTFFAEDGDKAERTWQKVRQGHLRHVSLGYRVTNHVRVEAGESQTIEGVTYTASEQRALRVALEWEPEEVSVTPMPADEAAAFRKKHNSNGKGNGAMGELEKLLDAARRDGESRADVVQRMAQKAGLKPGSVEAMLRGERQMTRRHVARFAKALSVREADVTAAAESDEVEVEPAEGGQDGGDGDGGQAAPGSDGGSGQRGSDGGQANRHVAGDGNAPGHGQSQFDHGTPGQGQAQDGGQAMRSGQAPGHQRDPEALATRAVEQERERVRSIRQAAGEDVDPELVERAVDEGWDVPQAHRAFLENIRAQRNGGGNGNGIAGAFGINVPEQAREAPIQRFEDAICMRSQLDLEPRTAGQRSAEQQQAIDQRCEQAERFAGMPILEAFRHMLRQRGTEPPASQEALMERALSTSQVSNVLSNVQNKSLQQGQMEAESTAMLWVGRKSLRDFKNHDMNQMSNAGDLVEIPDGGDFPHDTPKDFAEQIQLAQFGKKVVFGRKQMQNDDLDALTNYPRKLGMAAERKIDDLVYAVLLSNPTMSEDSKNLFSKTHAQANLIDGAATALDSGALTTGKSTMRKVKGLQDEHLNIMPAFILVPPELEHTGLELVRSSQIVLAGDTDRTRGSNNVHAGTLTVVPEPRLSGGVGGNSGSSTAWYLAARAGLAEHIVVGLLNGRRSPLLVRMDRDNPLSFTTAAIFDAAAAAADWRGMLKSKGAA